MNYLVLIALLFISLSLPLNAEDESAQAWDDFIQDIHIGPIEIGGSLAYQYRYKTYGEEDTGAGDFDFLRLKLDASYEFDDFKIAARYDFYRYEDYGRWTTWLEYAWISYDFDKNNTLYLGVHDVPFGVGQYSTHSWFETPAYYLGFEDDYDLGIKWVHKHDLWTLYLAYYLQDEGNYRGKSKNSASYTADVVEEGNSFNSEAHQFNVKLTRKIEHSENYYTELGGSLQYGKIPNSATDRDGEHFAFAVHSDGHYDRWHLKLSYINYTYDLENPAGQSDDIVVFGYFDFPYNVATDGQIYNSSLKYTYPIENKALKSISPFIEYSLFDKDKSGWRSTEQLATGLIWELKNWYVYSEVYFTKEHPDFGEGNYSTGLAQGTDGEWFTTYLVTFAYYF